MTKYILKRVGTSLLVLLLGSLLLFVLVINSEGIRCRISARSNDKNRENLIAQRTANMGLDRSWYERYWDWLSGASRCLIGQCDLGLNRAGQSVNDLTVIAAGSTLRLVVLATILAIVVGVVLGILTAVRQYSGFDYAVTFMAFVFFSLPCSGSRCCSSTTRPSSSNNWIVEAAIQPDDAVVHRDLVGSVLQAAMGGDLKRRLATFGGAAVVVGAALFYFDYVTWFRRPAIGLPIYILAVLGVSAGRRHDLRVRQQAGAQRCPERRSSRAFLGYALLRGTLMSSPSLVLLFGCFAAALAIAVGAGYLWGGFSRRQAVLASLVTALLASAIALTDLLLSNWSAYLKIQPRPVPTIGSQTPNVTFDFWGGWIDSLTHLVLPTIALTLISITGYTRYTRASMLDVLNQDYIHTARSKGISEHKVITSTRCATPDPAGHHRRLRLRRTDRRRRHHRAGVRLAGHGQHVRGWAERGRPAPVMAFFLVTGTAAVLMNLFADLAYAFLDPRITR